MNQAQRNAAHWKEHARLRDDLAAAERALEEARQERDEAQAATYRAEHETAQARLREENGWQQAQAQLDENLTLSRQLVEAREALRRIRDESPGTWQAMAAANALEPFNRPACVCDGFPSLTCEEAGKDCARAALEATGPSEPSEGAA